jgi:hypothetical protein
MRPVWPNHPHRHEVEMNMRAQIYFGVYADETAIEAVKLATPASCECEVKELGTKRSAEQKAQEPSRWLWRTRRKELDPATIEAEVEEFLQSIRGLPPTWMDAVANAEDRSLTLIIQLGDAERPNAFALSADAAKSLASLGGAFDVDYVSNMR